MNTVKTKTRYSHFTIKKHKFYAISEVVDESSTTLDTMIISQYEHCKDKDTVFTVKKQKFEAMSEVVAESSTSLRLLHTLIHIYYELFPRQGSENIQCQI
uniref:Uncharacterized protein n=1 Tax=Cacopsylla melanoneura TaxID=428564 RepID=A0A8D8LWR3_9HEMI